MRENSQGQSEDSVEDAPKRRSRIYWGVKPAIKMILFLMVFGSCAKEFTRSSRYETAYRPLPMSVISASEPRKSITAKGGLVKVDVLHDWKPHPFTDSKLQKGQLQYYQPDFNSYIYFACEGQSTEYSQWLKGLSPDEWNEFQLTVGQSVNVISSSSERIREQNLHVTLIEYSATRDSGRAVDVSTFVTRYGIGDQHCIAEYTMSKPVRKIDTHKDEFLRILESAKRAKNPKKK